MAFGCKFQNGTNITITGNGSDTNPYIVSATETTTLTANRQASSYLLALSDAGKVVEMNVGSANDLTVPANGTVAFPIGTVLEVYQYGAGQTTIVPAGGVTIHSPSGLKIAAQYGSASLRKIATDEWTAEGRLVVS